MAGGFIDGKVRVETNKWGKFCEDLPQLIPYAKVVGYDIAIPSDQKALPSPKAIEEQSTTPSYHHGKRRGRKRRRLSAHQTKALHAIETGATTLEAVREATGMTMQAKRCINNLIRFGRVKGSDGSYSIK
jgi:hypothetical protein